MPKKRVQNQWWSGGLNLPKTVFATQTLISLAGCFAKYFCYIFLNMPVKESDTKRLWLSRKALEMVILYTHSLQHRVKLAVVLLIVLSSWQT